MIKKLGKKVLKKVDDSHAFWIKTDHYNVIDRVKSLEDLAKKLKKAPTAAIVHHLREGRNDFADWIAYVLGDKVLAKELKSLKAKNWDQMQQRLVKSIEKRIKKLGKSGYKSKTKKELYDLAQKLDISGRSSMTKKELIKAIKSEKKKK